MSSIHWGPVYKSGPFHAGLEGANGSVTDIDVTKPWTSGTNSSWQLQSDWQNGKIYSLPADAETAWYWLQEITSSVDQPLLVNITSGDGVVVFLNGREQLIRLNPNRGEVATDVLLIHLKEGKNQLLVKFFNNFRKAIDCSVGQHTQQILYKKRLESTKLDAGKLYPVSWKLHDPITPHQTLLLPNLSLEIISDIIKK